MATPDRDPQLWRIAKARAKFKSHLLVYLLVNALLWAIWALTGRPANPLPWPVWSTAFWGLGILINGIGVYGAFSRTSLSEREYEKLRRQQQESR
jgi:hypothetical protein